MSRDANVKRIYYMVVYLFMNLGVFYVVLLLSKSGENISVNDLSGLARRAPLWLLPQYQRFSLLAGIPPIGWIYWKALSFYQRLQGRSLDYRYHRRSKYRYIDFLLPQPCEDEPSKEAVAKRTHLFPCTRRHSAMSSYFLSFYLGIMPFFGLTKLFSMAV